MKIMARGHLSSPIRRWIFLIAVVQIELNHVDHVSLTALSELICFGVAQQETQPATTQRRSQDDLTPCAEVCSLVYSPSAHCIAAKYQLRRTSDALRWPCNAISMKSALRTASTRPLQT